MKLKIEYYYIICKVRRCQMGVDFRFQRHVALAGNSRDFLLDKEPCPEGQSLFGATAKQKGTYIE